jgi:glutamyl-Q tRNA(Asp) synthetase
MSASVAMMRMVPGRPVLLVWTGISIGPEPKGVQPVFRFAPSPNGELHLGHAFSALLGFALSRRAGGRFLLRIEDIDPDRCRPEYEDAIYRDLAWLGLEWEEPVRRQSEHMDDYRAAIARLRQMDLVYPAFMSRAEIATATADPAWPRDPDGAPLYPPTDRSLSRSEAQARIAAGAAHALRIDVEKAIARAGRLWWREEGDGVVGDSGLVEANPAIWGDFVVARRDVPTSYHLAVVVDDAAQDVTHVVRGQDLFLATAAHRLLQTLFGLATPVYHHHRLITDATGRKLSKADRATSIRALREAGATADDIKRRVGIDAVLDRSG